MTDWQTLKRPGSTWEAGQQGITAGAQYSEFEGLIVYAGQLGIQTEWAAESKS